MRVANPFLFALPCLALATQPVAAHSIDDNGMVTDALPVGDGKVSTTTPQTGYVYACNDNFRQGGARHFGDWLQGDQWTPSEKVAIRGEVFWPEAYLRMSQQGERLFVEMNNLPVNQPTGTFPIAGDDPAYQFDTNPNPVKPQNLAFHIPGSPTIASEPGCLRLGTIGFTITGVALYNALDDAGLDAAAHEVQDACGGHPSGRGQYHFHAGSPCIPGFDQDAVVGWGLDGHPIMGMRDASGVVLTNAALDQCHGREEDVTVDGRAYYYAYRLTPEYPYTMGCYSGEVLRGTHREILSGLEERRGRGAGQGRGQAERRGPRGEGDERRGRRPRRD